MKLRQRNLSSLLPYYYFPIFEGEVSGCEQGKREVDVFSAKYNYRLPVLDYSKPNNLYKAGVRRHAHSNL